MATISAAELAPGGVHGSAIVLAVLAALRRDNRRAEALAAVEPGNTGRPRTGSLVDVRLGNLSDRRATLRAIAAATDGLIVAGLGRVSDSLIRQCRQRDFATDSSASPVRW